MRSRSRAYVDALGVVCGPAHPSRWLRFRARRYLRHAATRVGVQVELTLSYDEGYFAAGTFYGLHGIKQTVRVTRTRDARHWLRELRRQAVDGVARSLAVWDEEARNKS